MTPAEADNALKDLQAIHQELNQRAAAMDDINALLKDAQAKFIEIPAEEVPPIMDELKRHCLAFKQAAKKGLEIYRKLKAAGVGTPQLDKWEKGIREVT